MDSLLEYERLWGSHVSIDIPKIVRRMIAVERNNNPSIPDTYLDGLAKCYIGEKYVSVSQLLYQMPSDMAREYLTLQDGCLYVKTEKFEEWMEHIVSIPPSLFISGYWLPAFSLEMLQKPQELYSFVRNSLKMFAHTTMLHPFMPELSSWVEQTQGLHDLHVHLNGSTETDAVWIYILHHPDTTVSNFTRVYNGNSSLRKLAEQILPDFTPGRLKTFISHARQLRDEMLTMVSSIEHQSKSLCTKIDFLWKNFSSTRSFGPLIGEILLLLIAFAELRKTDNPALARKLHHYLLLKAVIHRFCVQQKDQIGFPQFQMITSGSFRDEIEKTYEQRFLQLCGSDKFVHIGTIEGRFSPKPSATENYKMLMSIESGFKKAVERMEKSKRLVNHKLQLKLVAHFIKKPETNNSKRSEIRHHFLRRDLEKKAYALVRTMMTEKGKHLIVGIDAAASELDTGPEVFAPVFHYLTKHGIRHLTYHAGEDFRHVLSGLRAVVEAVTFLRMKSGDRIGHGTALGIEPELWSERINGVCFLSQGEWLDDLVFLWNLIRCNEKLSDLTGTLPRIESAIAELSISVYGRYFHPSILLKTWCLREYDPECLFGMRSRSEALELYSIDEINQYEQIYRDKEIQEIMMKYHAPIDGSIFSINRKAYDRLIEVKIGQLIPCNKLRAIQNAILDDVSKRGIVIEALPTSNLRISYYRTISEYHIGRWIIQECKDTALPAVVIGSDDPGIFMTSIYNEYTRVYNYLNNSSVSSVERLDCMKKIRENSEIYKFS